MLQLVIVFLIVAMIAAFFGFYNVEHASVNIARMLFFVFLVLFILSLLGVGGIIVV